MKIALIAMSGIRVCDPELLEMGLTLPGFVERGKTIASLPSLGLITLAGMTPVEHVVRYVEIEDLSMQTELLSDVDLVAISSYSAQIHEAYELADRYRSKKVPVVIGGLHVTALPDEAGQHCDAVVIGEGEASWLSVLRDCERGQLSDRYGKVDGDFDLSDAPMPAFELLDVARYNRLTIQTSRGCPHRCEFCASSVLLTGRYKQKPVDKVLAEIDRVLSIWKQPFIEFADDNALVHKAYWKELLGNLGDRRIKWFAETDLTVSEDDELLALLRKTGCSQLLIGLESPTPSGLRGLELRNDWKYRRWADYRDAVQRIQSHGVTVNGCFVVGLDGHGPEIFDHVLEFVRDAELFEVQITIPTAFPGTPFYDRLKREGRLIEDGRWETCTLFDINFEPAGMSRDELSRGFKHLARELYGEEFTRWRRERFKKRLRERSRGRSEVGA